MYTLKVYFPGRSGAAHVEELRRGNDVLERIPELLKRYEGCDRIEVLAGMTRLFRVNSQGDHQAG